MTTGALAAPCLAGCVLAQQLRRDPPTYYRRPEARTGNGRGEPSVTRSLLRRHL
jgi:hypothetical protein